MLCSQQLTASSATHQTTCKRPQLVLSRKIRACSSWGGAVPGSSSSGISSSGNSIAGRQESSNCSGVQPTSRKSAGSSPQHTSTLQKNSQQRCIPQASASGNAAGDDSSGGSSSSRGGLLGALQKWNQDTRKLREQLQSLGLAGVVAYGLFNTLYYTVAFLVVWFTVANVPAGLGAQAAMRKAAEVFALVWAGSQVTKLLRAGGALAFAPAVDKGLQLAVEKLGLRSKQQAFALVVAACLAVAAAVFGAVVALHM